MIKITSPVSFPRVLKLKLSRHRIHGDTMTVGVRHNYFEYPEEIDLEPFLNFSAGRSEPYKYRLVDVVVIEGDSYNALWHAFLRTAKNGPFFKFFNEQVTLATYKEVFVDNFCGNGTDVKGLDSFAYILYYCRISQLDDIFVDVSLADIPASII